MKILQMLAWLLIACDLLFILFLFIEKNAGDDAAGRGVSAGYAALLLPLVLGMGALLYWSQNSTSKGLQWTAICIVAFPFFILGGIYLSNVLENQKYRAEAAQAGNFKDPQLTAIARAMDRKDFVAMRQLLGQTNIDWTARDGHDATLLGHAIIRIREDYSGTPTIEGLRILLASHAPLTDGATRPGEPLMESVYQCNRPGDLDMLSLLLDAGANPNALDKSGLPLILDTSNSVANMKILLDHGADIEARSNRKDRPGWSALMNAAYMRQWDQAAFFIERGANVKYKAPDGNTLASVIADRAAEQTAEDQTGKPGYAHFLELLNK